MKFHVEYVKKNKSFNIVKFKESLTEAIIDDDTLLFIINNFNESFNVIGDGYISLCNVAIHKNNLSPSYFIYLKDVKHISV